jgi:hypothetical protein
MASRLDSSEMYFIALLDVISLNFIVKIEPLLGDSVDDSIKISPPNYLKIVSEINKPNLDLMKTF